ncbi:MAG: hypothetical protein U9N56_07425 [Actinomycetota bacterium]|nr:hypothetical protein [Actinomycetota bacterium]
MVKVYAISLALGVVGLLVVILGGAFSENVGHPERDPGELIGIKGKAIVGAMVGFGMGGMSAEFSPLDFSWQISLAIAIVAGILSILWVRYAVAQAEG